MVGDGQAGGRSEGCRNCRLSLETLKTMQEKQTIFFTAGGRSTLQIAEVNERAQTLKMKRSTGKITWDLDYRKVKAAHDRIHAGELAFDWRELDKVIPTWGNYVIGLLQYLGCDKK